MTFDDLRKLLTRQTLFRLDNILAPRLTPILYALGLAGLLLWAVSHLFATFGSSFSNGLWGLLEIAVFGLLGVVALRIACEALLVFFTANESAGNQLSRGRLTSTSLLDEVRDAIRDLAEDSEENDGDPLDPYLDYAEPDVFEAPEPPPVPSKVQVESREAIVPVRRTARRAPKERL